jgi:hypothetical protein
MTRAPTSLDRTNGRNDDVVVVDDPETEQNTKILAAWDRMFVFSEDATTTTRDDGSRKRQRRQSGTYSRFDENDDDNRNNENDVDDHQRPCWKRSRRE